MDSMRPLAGDSAGTVSMVIGDLGRNVLVSSLSFPALSCSLPGERLGYHLGRWASDCYGQGAESQPGMRFFLQRTPWWVPALESQPRVT